MNDFYHKENDDTTREHNLSHSELICRATYSNIEFSFYRESTDVHT